MPLHGEKIPYWDYSSYLQISFILSPPPDTVTYEIEVGGEEKKNAQLDIAQRERKLACNHINCSKLGWKSRKARVGKPPTFSHFLLF